MPYIFKDPKEKQNQLVSGGGGALLGGGAGGQGGAASVPGAPKPSSSGFTNLRAYLDANKDQAMDLSGKLSEKLVGEGEAAKGGVDTLAGSFQSDLDKAKVDPNSDIISRANDNPAEFVKNQSDLDKFGYIKGGAFSGPGLFEEQPGYADSFNKVGEISDLASSTSKSGGRTELIKKLNPNMSVGNVSLNDLILSGSDPARSSLINAAQPYSDLRSYLSGKASSLDATRSSEIADLGTAQKKLQDEFITPQTKNLQDLQGQITSRVNDQGQNDSIKNAAIEALKASVTGKGALSAEQKAMFGLTDNGALQYGLNRDQMKNAIMARLKNAYPNMNADYQASRITDYISGQGPGFSAADEAVLSPFINEARNEYQSGIYSPNALGWLQGHAPENFLDTYFPGTSSSSGDLSIASDTTPDEAARILALQRLLGSQTPFLTDEDLAKAGTYKGASVGKFKGI